MGTNGTPNGLNGNAGILKWLLGLSIPTMLGLAIGWVTHTADMIHRHAENLAVLDSQVKDTRDELKRINVKLDNLLERKGRP